MSSSWTPLREKFLSVDPAVLVTGSPQMAKDEDYARVVQEAWRIDETCSSSTARMAEHTRIAYQEPSSSIMLHGHVICSSQGVSSDIKVPGVMLFHTGAGPHDVFLLWKADALVSNRELFPTGVVVMIADVLSDETGWGWSPDRSQYNEVRELVLSPNASGVRFELQSRIQAAFDTLKDLPHVDPTNLAAMGWCLGGHSILELARMQYPGVRAMVTFHGVFGDVPAPSTADDYSANKDKSSSRVLICNGEEDPFVSQDTLHAAVSTFSSHGVAADVMSFVGAKHGFTNPAQTFNSDPSFQYDDEAAKYSWIAALNLLQSQPKIKSNKA